MRLHVLKRKPYPMSRPKQPTKGARMKEKVLEGFLLGVGVFASYVFVLPVLQAIARLILAVVGMQMGGAVMMME